MLLCDGSQISAELYPELVKVLGGNTLPDLVGRFLEGADSAGEYKEAGLPNITGTHQVDEIIKSFTIDGAFYYDDSKKTRSLYGASSYAAGYIGFDASKSNPIYGSSTTVQPKSMTIKYYICYAG